MITAKGLELFKALAKFQQISDFVQ